MITKDMSLSSTFNKARCDAFLSLVMRVVVFIVRAKFTIP